MAASEQVEAQLSVALADNAALRTQLAERDSQLADRDRQIAHLTKMLFARRTERLADDKHPKLPLVWDEPAPPPPPHVDEAADDEYEEIAYTRKKRGATRISKDLPREVRSAGVAIRSGAVVDADAVLALSPDRVILATGARLTPPEGLRCDEALQDARLVAAKAVQREGGLGGTIVLFDHDHTAMTYALVELLASRSDRVFVLTPRETVARDLPLIYAQGVHTRLAKAKAAIIPYARPVFFGDRHLVWRHELTGEEGEIAEIDLFTYATPRIPNDALAGPLRAAGLDPLLVGDARMPRAMLSAMAEGHAAGETI